MQSTELGRRKDSFFLRIGHVVTTARCVATLFSCGLAALIVGTLCFKRGQEIDETDGDNVQDPLTTAGIIFLAIGAVTVLQAFILAVMSCKNCGLTPKTFATAGTATDMDFQTGHDHGINGTVEEVTDGIFVIELGEGYDDIPPPYPEEEPPPPYPGNV